MIKGSHIFFSYTGKAPYLLDSLSFHANRGDYISITGENGCGKSTFLKILLGFLTPQYGNVEVRASRIGYVPQRAHVLGEGFPLTVEELLDSYRRLLHIKDKKETDRVLEELGVTPLRKSLLRDLSGGQQQKVLLARALIGSPDLLILDEPTTGIDLKSQGRLYGELRRLSDTKHMTILSVEHNPQCAAYSNSIFYISEGQGRFMDPASYARQYVPAAFR